MGNPNTRLTIVIKSMASRFGLSLFPVLGLGIEFA